ncbi:Hypothetical protein SCF082_LOCUS42135 [Durusdinium trenchii]
MAIAPLAAHIDISCLVFFTLGVKPEIISAVAGGSLGIHGMCFGRKSAGTFLSLTKWGCFKHVDIFFGWT